MDKSMNRVPDASTRAASLRSSGAAQRARPQTLRHVLRLRSFGAAQRAGLQARHSLDERDVDLPLVPNLTQAQTNAMHQLLRIAPVIDDLGRLFTEAGHEIYLVGGSVRDAEVIAAADEQGIAMVLTGFRHFRH